MELGRLLSGLSMLFSRAKLVVVSITFSCVFFFLWDNEVGDAVPSKLAYRWVYISSVADVNVCYL